MAYFYGEKQTNKIIFHLNITNNRIQSTAQEAKDEEINKGCPFSFFPE